MKLKKTLSIIMAATVAMFTISGCSEQTLNYSKELNNMAKWEATTSNFQGEVNVDVMGQSDKITVTGTSYIKGKTQGYMEFKFNDQAGKINIPELKMYIDNGVSYINKAYYESNFTSHGMSVPTGLANVQAEYIGINSGLDMAELTKMSTSPADALAKLSKSVFGDSNIDLPFVQNGREYTMNFDANQAIDLTSKTVKAISNNLDNINTTFKLGLNAEMLQSAKTAINDPAFDTQLNQAKTLLEGSTISTKETFSDNQYKADINMNLQIKDMGKITGKITSTSDKSEVKAVEIPTSKVMLTQDEFAKLMMPEKATLENQSSTK
ncbi:hypothetical protein [Clostridium uliginosum]|uniref:Lipoprotein n=1 Tax=Clostridium uliginosum TaxID=119641 RepID=A0A1I1PID2_9CLOT|nr:hypothetical protein [Clostridium uliginosum]SFD09432.1 hypothetical protein SAMN05421842_11954 [Clostridium uliginosum]